MDLRSEVQAAGLVERLKRRARRAVVLAVVGGVAAGTALGFVLRGGPRSPATRPMHAAPSAGEELLVEDAAGGAASEQRFRAFAQIGGRAGKTATTISPDGSPWVAFNRCRQEPCRGAGLAIAKRTDGVWRATQLAGEGAFDFDLAVDAAGAPLVAWASTTDWVVHTARQLPSGEWDEVSLPTTLRSNADRVQLVSIEERVYLLVASKLKAQSFRLFELAGDVWRELAAPDHPVSRIAWGDAATTDGHDLFVLFGQDEGKITAWQIARYSPAASAWLPPIPIGPDTGLMGGSLVALGRDRFCLAGTDDHHLLLACGGPDDLWQDRRVYPNQQIYGPPILARGSTGEPLVIFDHWSNERLMLGRAGENQGTFTVLDDRGVTASGLSTAGSAIAFTWCDKSGCTASFGDGILDVAR